MRGRHGHQTLHRRYGRAHHVAAWHPGDAARTTVRIPADPHPIFPPVDVVVQEVMHFKGTRHKDSFGNWTTFGKTARIRVGYRGQSYWVDAESLERP